MREPAAETSLALAHDALERGDWEDARAAFGQALAEAETAQAREGLSWAAWWLDDGEMAIRERETAYRLYRQEGDDIGAARMAMWLGVDYADFRGEMAIARGWRERARSLLDGRPIAPEHGWMPLLECWTPIVAGEDPQVFRRRADEALAVARHCGDPDIGIVALAVQGFAQVGEGSVDDGMKRLEEAAAAVLGGELEDEHWGLKVYCLLIAACERVRDFGRAAEWCGRMQEMADRMRIADAQGICQVHYGAVLVSCGDWSHAEASLARATDLLAASRRPWVAEAAVRLANLRARQGRMDEAAELLHGAPGHPLTALAWAELSLEAGRPRDGEDLIERFLRHVPATNRFERVAALDLLVRICTLSGNRDRAGEALAELEAIADAVATLALRGTACLAKAVVAVAMEDPDRARACCEDAVDLFERSGMPYDEALARIELAGVLVTLGRLERARTEAGAARATLDRLGARPASERAGAMLADIERSMTDGRRGYTEARAADLSPRQVEVLRLVASGKTNKAVAAELFLSEKTVDRHLSNIFNKLGVSSRTAATAYAYRHNLV